MQNKTVFVLLVLLLCAGLIGAFCLKDFFMSQTEDRYQDITDLEAAYQADEEIKQAFERLKTNRGKATVITQGKSGYRHIALTFDGLSDRATVQKILDILKRHDAKATFFVDGILTADDPQTVVNIRTEGQRIENYSLAGIANMETLPMEQVVNDFCRAQKIIKITTGKEPTLLKLNDTQYTDNLLQAAKACGFNSVVRSDLFFNARQTKTLKNAEDFVGKIRPGSIISIKLKPNSGPIANGLGKTDLRPAIDKQPGLKELPEWTGEVETEIIDGIERLLVALKAANYTTVFIDEFFYSNIVQTSITTTSITQYLSDALRFVKAQAASFFSFPTAHAAGIANNKAQEIKTVSTTEPAISYTFGGLFNSTAVNHVLEKLDILGIKATFFIMEIEMTRYPETVRQIISRGHEIGIAIRPQVGGTVEETRDLIMRSRKLLQESFGVTTNLVKQPWGVVEDATKVAVAASDCLLIGQSVNVVQTKHKDYTTADQVMAEIFGKHVFSLARGQIVHFRMDYYTNDRLVSELVEVIKQRKIDNIAYATSFDNPANNPANDSQYVIKPVGAVLNNINYRYSYPAEPDKIPLHLRDSTGSTIGKHSFLSEVAKRYIGNDEVTYEDRILGFSKKETRRLDTNGFVHTDEKVIFLTFDDWGTDASINKILYVLRKHDVVGIFFIITRNVLHNPNLLRAIVAEGHEIGSHSDQHSPMVVRDPKTGRQVKTQDEITYREDVTTAYKKLRDVTGDVIVDGKPALTRFFRPPTLAISKMGFETLFSAGYEYIISGSGNTYDYKAKDITQLVRRMKDTVYTREGEVKKGAIMIMHMGDASVYTAMALDILLTANKAKADSDPTKFTVGRLSDYLIDGYAQNNRPQSLRLQNERKTSIM